MSIQNLIKQLEKSPKFKNAFKKDLAFEVAQMIIESRIRKGYTQGELAKKMKTHQSGIARVERGTYLPSLSFLEKMAVAYGSHLIPPKFAFMKDYEFSFSMNSVEVKVVSSVGDIATRAVRSQISPPKNNSMYAILGAGVWSTKQESSNQMVTAA